jgi:hypothetical protein
MKCDGGVIDVCTMSMICDGGDIDVAMSMKRDGSVIDVAW